MKRNLVCLVTLALMSLGVGTAQDPTVATLDVYLPPDTTSLGDCSGEAMSQCDFAKHALPLDNIDSFNRSLSTSDNPSVTFSIEDVSHQYGLDEMKDSFSDLVEMTVTAISDKESLVSSIENGDTDFAFFDSLDADQQERLRMAGATIIIIGPNGPIGVCYCLTGPLSDLSSGVDEQKYRLFNQLVYSYTLSQ